LGIAAEVGSVLGGALSWEAILGRRDSLNASQPLTNQSLSVALDESHTCTCLG